MKQKKIDNRWIQKKNLFSATNAFLVFLAHKRQFSGLPDNHIGWPTSIFPDLHALNFIIFSKWKIGEFEKNYIFWIHQFSLLHLHSYDYYGFQLKITPV